MTPDELRADHAKALGYALKAVDSKGNTNAEADVSKVAFNGVRSALYAKLSAESPAPSEDKEDEGDPELIHARQKKHNKSLWKQVEALVAAAGLSESGMGV